jgi:hypothetical protein
MNNVLHKRATHSCQDHTKTRTTYNASTQQFAISSKEGRIQLALQVTQRNATMIQLRAVSIYNIFRKTLSRRLAGSSSQRNCTPNSMNLSKIEEEVVFQHILDLDARGFSPRLAAVKHMADSLLAECHHNSVDQNWVANFVKRQPELKVKFN